MNVRATIGIAATMLCTACLPARKWTSPVNGHRCTTRTPSSGFPVRNWVTTPGFPSARRAGCGPSPGMRIASRWSRSISAARTRPTIRSAGWRRCASGPTTIPPPSASSRTIRTRRVRESADDLPRRTAHPRSTWPTRFRISTGVWDGNMLTITTTRFPETTLAATVCQPCESHADRALDDGRLLSHHHARASTTR